MIAVKKNTTQLPHVAADCGAVILQIKAKFSKNQNQNQHKIWFTNNSPAAISYILTTDKIFSIINIFCSYMYYIFGTSFSYFLLTLRENDKNDSTDINAVNRMFTRNQLSNF